MKTILYSIYTGGYPNRFTGGPNNIIYKVIDNQINYNLNVDYLSYDLFIENLTRAKLDKLEEARSIKKKVTSRLARTSNIYRKIFSSDYYLPYHFYKKEKYYKQFKNRINKYDIIHSQDSISLALLTKECDRVKKIITVHSKGPLSDELRLMVKSKTLKNKIDKRLKRVELKSIEMADIITFPSLAAKYFFEESLNVSLQKNKVKIIYNGINFDKIYLLNKSGILSKYSINENGYDLLLLNIAANAPEKNIDILLKVVEKLKNKFNKNVLFLNVGIEKNIPYEIKNIIEKLNIQNNVKFLGRLPNDDVIKLLKATDIFVMTSEKVIFDLVVLEALASGACCVVSNEGGNKEIIKDGENGYLIDLNDVDEIAKKIISINPNKVKENAIETAKQFSVQKMVEEYFEVYESLLDGV